MNLIIHHEELSTILNNNMTICEALLEVTNSFANFGPLDTDQPAFRDLREFIDSLTAIIEKVERSHNLILQCLKSNTAICHQVGERNHIWD